MNIFKINTTAYEEEDFFVQTTLTEKQIIKVIEPIVLSERDGEEDYDNDVLVRALKKAYPNDTITMFTNFETISI